MFGRILIKMVVALYCYSDILEVDFTMLRKTKIICTLGPATDDDKVLRQLMLSGMNVARFNFSHQTHEEHKQRFDKIVKMREELGLPIATLLDTKGPEIRIHTLKDGKAILKEGNTFTLYTKERIGDETGVSITYQDLPKDIALGTRILIDDGLIELKVTSFDNEKIVCTVVNGGKISDRKSINVPDISLSLPYVSEKDESDIVFGIETGFDFIAASFTRSAQDIMDIRSILNKHNCHWMKIIAKIENREGVENIDEILRLVDGIMVARGDMGVEIPFEQLPPIQKMLIKKAYRAGKQVITATQMLDSMMQNPRPTRAETSDVANAIYDGTSAIMLSGETAAGKYPVEALKAMTRIAEETETNIHYKKRFATREATSEEETTNVTNAISKATVTTAHNLLATAIITVTKSGMTAREISKFRPNVPIIGGSTDPRVYRQMNLSWGVYPVFLQEKDTTDELFDHVVDVATEADYLSSGDLVVITAGIPLGISGTTNMIKVHVVGNVLISGTGISHGNMCGNLCVCRNAEEAKKKFKKGDILVIPQTDNTLIDVIRDASGIIVEQDGLNSHAAIAGLALDIPVIIGAHDATKVLKHGITVQMDAERGIISSTHQH